MCSKKAINPGAELNEAREKFTVPDDIPEPEKTEPPKVNHKRIWKLRRFVGAVRRLHIEPDHGDAIAILKFTNENIDKINTSNGFPEGCGRFPLEFLRYNYRSAHAMLKSYNDSDDAEHKAHVTLLFRSFSETTKEFCTERGLPLEWAWTIKEITEIPVYLNEYQATDDEALAGATASNSNMQMEISAANISDNTQQPSGSDGQPTTISGTPNNVQLTNSAANIPNNMQQPSGSDGQSAITSGNTTQGNDPSPQLGVSQPGGPQPTLTYTTNASRQAPAYKRNIGRHYVQYLVTEDSRLHVWKKESDCLGMDLTNAEFLIKPTREFVAQHKPLYDKVTWIAMPVDEAITHGAGAHPPVTINVQWKGGLEDTPLWRTDLISMVGRDQVARDIQQHLPHHGWVESEGQKVWVESPTANGWMKGRGKAIQRLSDQRAKAAKAYDLATSASMLASSLPQPTTSQPAAPYQGTPAVHQSTVPQPPGATVPQPAAAQPMPAQSAASQPVDLTNPQVAAIIQQLMQLMSPQLTA